MTDDHVATLRVADLQKHFRRQAGSNVAAVHGVSLQVDPGTMVAVLGPSGSGKTTLLRCIAGLEAPTGGEIWFNGQLLSSGKRGIVVPPEKRGFGMMFQSYALFPHMTVYGNVSYPLNVRRIPKPEVDRRVAEMLDVVGIGSLRAEYPANLSGGQQQRVALARCLVSDPQVILFDEPLSNVDAKVREELRVELLAMHKRLGFAGLYVTHDQEEAMVIADRVAVMNHGKIVQIDTPRQLYRRPTSQFVAGFVGTANIWEGHIEPESRHSALTTVTTNFGAMVVATENVADGLDSGEVVVMARPEGLSVTLERPSESADETVLPGVLRAEIFRGSHIELLVEARDHLVRVRGTQALTAGEGSQVYVVASSRALRVLPRSDEPTRQTAPTFGHPDPSGSSAKDSAREKSVGSQSPVKEARA